MTEIVQTMENIELKNYELNEFNPLTSRAETNPFGCERFSKSFMAIFNRCTEEKRNADLQRWPVMG